MALPTDISGLTNWYKADSLALANGAAVTSWADSSGSGYTLSQATVANQPTYVTNARNGLPGISFNGTTNYLSGTGGTSSGFTAWAVFSSSITTSGALLQNGNGNGWILQIFSGYDLTWRLVSDNAYGTYTANTWAIMAGYAASGSGNPAGLIVNGTTLGTFTNGFTSPPSAQTFVGTSDNQTSYVKGTICELVQYSRRLSATEIAQVDTYLSNRYAISVSDYIFAPAPALRIPNKFVGPMAMRNRYRNPTVAASYVAAPVIQPKSGQFFVFF